ncbi:MAG: TetR/AcrR family transcriptional regulator [Intrasporangium sp.]|uniref:TetR/AcrR family transcriptional regulator n=1 Tax=Intrasporangium sp. TaxID=1925024 RepID=UPI00264A4A6D|nr:TetR/AcrR family transcriptional regulator [Intrasporangium sp.]MDN5797407.1 TetR/AcrR family transcriptional regulator [Intrasporangium sp.]
MTEPSAEAAALTPRARARREDVLAELRTLFLAAGFADLTMADLAERLHCSRSTLYLVAPSKEQIVVATVRSYFRAAATSIERRLASETDAVARLRLYLDAVAEELSPASPAFHRDVAAFAPAREVYRQNTQYAAQRVRALIDDGVAAGRLRRVDAAFVGAAAGEVMAAIQRGSISVATGLDDAAAYYQLADLLVHGLETRHP